MAHFARTRINLAAWAVGTEVTNVEFDDIDGKTFKAINGDDGGTWAPSSAIVIGGSGMQFTGTVEFTGTGALKGDADIDAAHFQLNGGGGEFKVAALTRHSAATHFTSHMYLGGGAPVKMFTVGDAVNANEIQIANNAVARVLAGGLLTVDATGGASFNGVTTLAAGGTHALADKLTCSGVGRVVRRYVPLPDLDQAYTIANGDEYYLANGVLSANRVYTLAGTGAAAGDVVEVFCFEQTKTMTFNALIMKFVSGQRIWAKFLYTGSAWVTAGEAWLP